MFANPIIHVKINNAVISFVLSELYPVSQAFENDRLIDIRVRIDQLAISR